MCLTNHMGFISRHITPIVIKTLRVDTHTHTHMHTDVRIETILRIQVHTGLWLVWAWFKKTHVDILPNKPVYYINLHTYCSCMSLIVISSYLHAPPVIWMANIYSVTLCVFDSHSWCTLLLQPWPSSVLIVIRYVPKVNLKSYITG